jgi:superfamily I DNA and/or RNA helicase
MLYDVHASHEDTTRNGSKFNKAEAAFCAELCSTRLEMCSELLSKQWSVGFVSLHKEQVSVIREAIRQRKTIPRTVSIDLHTVNAFQGREKDVKILSCARASNHGRVGFLSDMRRLNVAITRARFCLVFVGNTQTLSRDKTW